MSGQRQKQTKRSKVGVSSIHFNWAKHMIYGTHRKTGMALIYPLIFGNATMVLGIRSIWEPINTSSKTILWCAIVFSVDRRSSASGVWKRTTNVFVIVVLHARSRRRHQTDDLYNIRQNASAVDYRTLMNYGRRGTDLGRTGTYGSTIRFFYELCMLQGDSLSCRLVCRGYPGANEEQLSGFSVWYVACVLADPLLPFPKYY
uniref:Innexin n=1 Tax=Steinernema glaseri TaxID=37863 RepID=A0A1I8AD31_9BILA